MFFLVVVQKIEKCKKLFNCTNMIELTDLGKCLCKMKSNWENGKFERVTNCCYRNRVLACRAVNDIGYVVRDVYCRKPGVSSR